MDYGYAPKDLEFGDRGGVFNDEQEAQGQGGGAGEEDYYEEIQHQQQRQEPEEIGSAGNQRKQSRDPSSSVAGKLFVGGISWETTEETFTSYFSKYGEVMDSVIMMDRHTRRPRGFGFVTFADPPVADRVLEEEHIIDGRTVEVKKTVPRDDMRVKGVIRTKKIFVGGIPPSLTEDELKEYFSLYGSVVEPQIMLDHKTGRSRGFGFVTFASEDAVEQIFSEDKIHELGGKQVEIKRAEPKRTGDYGSTAKSYGGFGNSAGGYGAGNSAGGYGAGNGAGVRYGGKMGRGYSEYGSYGGYSGNDNFGGAYSGSAASFYGGYGGYGYGFGFGGSMMYGTGAGAGAAYGGAGYGTPSGYGSAAGYSVGKGYGRTGDSGSYGSSKAYGNGDALNGSYNSGKGNGGSANTDGRYHPYRR